MSTGHKTIIFEDNRLYAANIVLTSNVTLFAVGSVKNLKWRIGRINMKELYISPFVMKLLYLSNERKYLSSHLCFTCSKKDSDFLNENHICINHVSSCNESRGVDTVK